MNNKIKIFGHEEFGEVRTITKGEKILFCGKDIAKALGYKNTKEAINLHCKGVEKHDLLTKGGKQQLTFIQEPDVYRLIIKSKLPQAQKFERWIFEEILPDIRKHGMYMTTEKLYESMTDPEMLIQILQDYKKEKEQRIKLEKEQKKLKPKANYCDEVLKCKKAINITVIAKDYGMSAASINKILHELRIQYKSKDTWVLYQDYANKGYTKSETITKDRETNIHMCWTQKGRLFLYDILKQNNILPLMEQV